MGYRVEIGPCASCGCGPGPEGCSVVYYGETTVTAPDTITAILTFPWSHALFTGVGHRKITSTNLDTSTTFVEYFPNWQYMHDTYGVTIPTMDCEQEYEYTEEVPPVPVTVITDTCGSVDDIPSLWECTYKPTCSEDSTLEIVLDKVALQDLGGGEYSGNCCDYYGEAEITFAIPWKARRLTMATFTSEPPFSVVVDYPNGFTESSGTVNQTYKLSIRFTTCTGMMYNTADYTNVDSGAAPVTPS